MSKILTPYSFQKFTDLSNRIIIDIDAQGAATMKSEKPAALYFICCVLLTLIQMLLGQWAQSDQMLIRPAADPKPENDNNSNGDNENGKEESSDNGRN